VSVRPVRFGHIGLAARDLEGMVEFYEQALAMQISDRMVYPEHSPFYEGVWLRINTDHHVISLFGLRAASAFDAPGMGRVPRPGVHHIGFEVASFADLRDVLDYARSHDVPVHAMRSGGPGNQLRIYLLDPEENIVELYFAMDQVGWDGATRPYPPIEEIDLDTFDIESWLTWKGNANETGRGY
jgi:catechol 2,3-dioxygenase-like lactoylglutathione lyase family enzyme